MELSWMAGEKKSCNKLPMASGRMSDMTGHTAEHAQSHMATCGERMDKDLAHWICFPFV